MEKRISPTLKSNEFVVHEDHGYATTAIEISDAAEYLMTKLEPIEMEELKPEDRVCSICHSEFVISEHVTVSHPPVKMECGHIFGRNCIIRWLDPLSYWTVDEEIIFSDPIPPWNLWGNSGCPICRREFFRECAIEPMEVVVCRLAFWDMAYASAGVARSEKEKRSRKYLVEYIEYCHSIKEFHLDDTMEAAQDRLLIFVKHLQAQELTPEQENLREKLERIGRKDLTKCPVENGSYVFNIDRNDNEREIVMYPLVEPYPEIEW
ncbi:hypothetical protein MMC07_008989 [Pseudocyphellaria aurata]|nr:hypothetical protein [Pseudocyphellaria aurata]